VRSDQRAGDGAVRAIDLNSKGSFPEQ
jgi:hypothetical protein